MRRRASYSSTFAFFLSSTRSLSSGRTTGLYGFDSLKTAKGFRKFVDEAIERSTELVSYISSMPPSMEVIRRMDEISNTVCHVVDSAELCRHTHPDREFVDEATDASIRMNDYLHFLNTNHNLYNAVKKAEGDKEMTTEARRLAHSLRVDFEKGGIHLCQGKMDLVSQLNSEIAQLGREFNENIISNPGSVDIFPDSRITKLVRHLGRPIYRYTKTPLGHPTKERGLQLKTDQDSLNSILRYVSDAEVRRMAYISGNSVPHANIGVLDKLIACRHELAEAYDWLFFLWKRQMTPFLVYDIM